MILHRTFDIDLSQPVRRTHLDDLMVAGDRNAHRITLRIARDGERADMTGAVIHAYVIRADGSTLILPGEGGEGTAAFLLTEGAYRIPGRLSLLVRAAQGEEITTLWWGEGTVAPGSTDQLADPERIIPSLPDLLARITLLENTTLAAQQITEQGSSLVHLLQEKLDSGAFTGRGLTILGHYPAPEALASLPDPRPGDAYAVGSATPYQIYIYDGVGKQFRSHGVLQGAKGDPGLTTSVNGVEQTGGNVQLMAGHIPTKDGRSVEQVLESLPPQELWQGEWSSGAIRPAASPTYFRYFLLHQGAGVALVPRTSVMAGSIRTLWQSPDGQWHRVEQLYLLQADHHTLTITASKKYLDGIIAGPGDPITRVVGLR